MYFFSRCFSLTIKALQVGMILVIKKDMAGRLGLTRDPKDIVYERGKAALQGKGGVLDSRHGVVQLC